MLKLANVEIKLAGIGVGVGIGCGFDTCSTPEDTGLGNDALKLGKGEAVAVGFFVVSFRGVPVPLRGIIERPKLLT